MALLYKTFVAALSRLSGDNVDIDNAELAKYIPSPSLPFT
ncbi:hypothetical protein GCM10008934_37000 [Virgibacillus salarius]